MTSRQIDHRTKKWGRVLDICDKIISVAGLNTAFSGEMVYFTSKTGKATGFVWNLEDGIAKVALLTGRETMINIGDDVFRSYRLVRTRCGFGVLGEVMNPLGDFLAKSVHIASEAAISRLLYTY